MMPIKVLAVHNRYLARGGEDESHEADIRLLRERGHEVVEYVEDNRRVANLGSARIALKSIWSRESYDIVRQKIRATRPDIIQVQNFFPLISPSIYYAARAEGVPVVQILHNYRLFCLNALYYRQGHVCEDCQGHLGLLPGIVYACYRNNRLGSASVALMLTFHWLLHTWQRTVDAFVALTEFSRQKFIAGGLPAGKILVKPNFVNLTLAPGNGDGSYALFAGRLSAEKGINTLLHAWQEISDGCQLVVAGDGPLKNMVVDASSRRADIRYVGWQSSDQVLELMRNASFLIFPSECYESFGRSIIESFASGTPVVTSRLGAMSELVTHQQTGLHFRAGDVDDLRAQIAWAFSHPDQLRQMRQTARAEFETKYTADRNYQRAIEIYETVIAAPRLK